jgi:hypothetical protein
MSSTGDKPIRTEQGPGDEKQVPSKPPVRTEQGPSDGKPDKKPPQEGVNKRESPDPDAGN